ncbi:MAG: bifunctional nuclease family protein, partial [Deltaproteobacteria bacterium]|nr:bifunctional nuclease family protein [Deltaproteobacteria bacterium]
PGSNAPIVILKDASGEQALPIWIGLAEATAIASALKQVPFVRPMTHDLLRNSIEELGGRVVRIVISDLRDSTFIANIEVRVGDSLHIIDSRPSDALALAVRVHAPIFVSNRVLAQAQVAIVKSDSPLSEGAPGSAEESGEEGETEEPVQGEQQDFSHIERDQWADLLADLDPDDFKYKM